MKFLFILTFGVSFSHAQTIRFTDELFGFRLGQYKTVVTNELGEPNQTQVMDDSTVIDFYYISKDSSAYVGFQYIPAKPTEIYAIQLSGSTAERQFYGISLQDSETKLIPVFGNPDTLLVQEFHDRKSEIWKYSQLNLSILLTDRKIESIRIWDDYEQKDYNHPTIEHLLEIIKTKDQRKIADILSPGIEVYYCDNVITWNNSFYKDIYLEKSSVLDFITNDEYGLVSLSGKKDLKHNLELRVVIGAGTFPVYKFPEETLISEVVLNYQQGRYKIWEIKYKCEN